MVGRDAFIEASLAGMGNCDGYHHEVDRYYDQLDPDSLIVEYHSSTKLRPDNRLYANKYLGILRFDDELVSYWKEYVNPLPIVEAYGLDFKNAAVAA